MYATREQTKLSPTGLGLALAINGGVVAALLMAQPELIERLKAPPLPIEFITLPKPKPTDPPKPQPEIKQSQPRTATAERPVEPETLPPLPTGLDTGTGPVMATGTSTPEGPIVTPSATPLPPPVLVAAVMDPRYAADLQPPYPDHLRDRGLEGVVKLRIRISADGRVTTADVVSGDPALARIASRHAVARWRFRPATRGGVPEDSVQTMLVRFRLDGGG